MTVPGFTGAGAVTVRVPVSVTPPLVALIVLDPAAMAVASPLPFTVATARLLDVHAIGSPVRTLPDKSLSVAVNWDVPPTVTLAEGGLTVTEATATEGRPFASVRSSIHMY